MRRPLFAALWLAVMTIPLDVVQAHIVAQDRISVLATPPGRGRWLPPNYTTPKKTGWSNRTCNGNGNLRPAGWCKGFKRRSEINHLPLRLSP